MSDKPVRVLVIEDDVLMRDIVVAVLGKLGCDVVGEAGSGSEAVQVFRAHRPDITFLDINLGGSNGLDVLRRIRRIAADARVVMLTASDDTTVAEHCLVNGAQGYIVKGDAGQSLQDAISAHLEPVSG